MLRPYFFRCTFPRHVTPAAMADLKRSLRLFDGLAMVVGIMVGSGIFRTSGLVAAQLGRSWLTFVAWVLGGALAFLGALCFAELATRHPRAGGKYVYVREAFGPRAGFVVGWVESVGMYTAAIAAIGVAAAEFLVRLTGWDSGSIPWLGAGLVALFTAVNLIGVASGRWVQNLVTAAKVLALGGVVAIAFARGAGAGWHGALAAAPRRAGAREWRRDALGRHAAGGGGRGRARGDRHLREAARPRHRGSSGDRRPHRGGAVPAACARASGPVQRARLSGGADPVHRRVSRPFHLDRAGAVAVGRSEEHTSELQSPCNLVCRLLLEKKKKKCPLYPASDALVIGVRAARLHAALCCPSAGGDTDEALQQHR